jgi:hypothetical protein
VEIGPQGVDQNQLIGRDADGARVKALLRRVEFGYILLPCRNNLVWSLRDAAQTDAIRFLPQLAETLQRSEEWAALHVPGTRSGRYFLYVEALDRLSPDIYRPVRHLDLGWLVSEGWWGKRCIPGIQQVMRG